MNKRELTTRIDGLLKVAELMGGERAIDVVNDVVGDLEMRVVGKPR